MIEVRELTKRYGGVTAVQDLSFTVRPGQVTGFLGPNGAGKPNGGLGHFRFGNDAWAVGRLSPARLRDPGHGREEVDESLRWR